MITKIHIERFKSIRELELDFGRVNLFIGGNGSGKSNLLEAIGVMSATLSRGLTDNDFSRKGVRITPATLMKSAFKNADLPKSLTLKADFSNGLQYSCSLTASINDTTLSFRHENCVSGDVKIFGRSPNGASANGKRLTRSLDKYRGIWDQTRALSDYPTEVANELDQLAAYAIFAPQTEFLRGIKTGSIATPPIGLHGEGLPGALKALLRDINAPNRNRSKQESQLMTRAMQLMFKPDWAHQVQVGRLSDILKSRDLPGAAVDMVYFVDRFMHAKRNKLSAYDSSEGTLFLLFSAILLAHIEAPKIFAMDNVDSALNPKLTRVLLETIIEVNRLKLKGSLMRGPEQVFLTSHNPTSLDAFDIFDDDCRIFVVMRGPTGETLAERLIPPSGVSKEDWRIASKDRNLSQMWIDGEIKGALGGRL